MRPETVGRIVFLALFAFCLYLMYLIFKPFLAGIVWATVLVAAFSPLHERLVGWLRGRRALASGLLSLLLALFLVVPTGMILVKVAQGLAQGYAWLQAQHASGRSVLDVAESVPLVSALVDYARPYLESSQIDLRAMALAALKNAGNAMAGKAQALVTNAIQTVLTFCVLMVTMVVLFYQGPALVEAVRRFLPLQEEDKEEVFQLMRSVVRAVFFGVLMTALVQAVVGAIGFAIVGLPAVVTLGAALFFCALLPGGPVLVWLPAALYLLAQGSYLKAGFIAAWGILVIGSMDNIIRPIFIGRGVKMHLLLVFFGILGGMMAFGLIGLFTGPLVITVFLFLLEVLRRDFFREAGSPGSSAGFSP